MRTIKEGVGDKLLYQNLGIPDDFSKFNIWYNSQERQKETTQTNNIIFANSDDVTTLDYLIAHDWVLIKNPNNLKNFGANVRGVIMPNGDFYLENKSDVIHNDILKTLSQKGLFKAVPQKNWGRKLPSESGFLTVQRYKDSDFISIGESNRLIYTADEYEKHKQEYIDYMNAAQGKCPGIKFVPKLVGVKYDVTGAGSVMKESINFMNDVFQLVKETL
jgi:hypothetical protein